MPTAALYHRYVPPGAVAVIDAVLPEQIVVPLAVGATGIGFTVIVPVAFIVPQPPVKGMV